MEEVMVKERHRLKTDCPECGCGLIDNMTPDEFREKQGEIKNKDGVDSTEANEGHENIAVEEGSS